MTTTTREAYAALHRNHVGPALRGLGFKGSGGSYAADRPGAFVNLGFQRSSYGDRFHTMFTINLTVAPVDAWNAARALHPVLSARPAPNDGYMEHLFGTRAWQARIGFVMPGGTDRWWNLTPATDLGQLGTEVISAVRGYALPAIDERLEAFGLK